MIKNSGLVQAKLVDTNSYLHSIDCCRSSMV